jgi:hypothetical protein
MAPNIPQMSVPIDIVLTLFETLNESNKQTREQIKELTAVMTKVVMLMDKEPKLSEVKECVVENVEGIKISVNAKVDTVKTVLEVEIIKLLKDLLDDAKVIKIGIKIAMAVIIFGIIAGSLIVTFYGTPIP